MEDSSRLQIPPIVVDPSSSPDRPSTPSSSAVHSRQPSEGELSVGPRPSTRDTTYLTTQGQESFDGETLRERANSVNSNVDTLHGSAAPSTSAEEYETALNKADEKMHDVQDSKGLNNTLDYDDVPLEEALKADQRNEKDFWVDNNPFAFSPGQLNKMLNPKSLAAFRALGGLRGLERGLRTDLSAGLSIDESSLGGSISFEEATRLPSENGGTAKESHSAPAGDGSPNENQFRDRYRVYDNNKLPERKADGFLVLFWQAYNDRIIILLTIAAVVSLSLGLYEKFSGGSQVDWIEGVAICVAILIVTLVTAGNDWQKERQFVKLNRRKNDREVKAIRSGKSIMISIFDVTVGDVLHLEPGDAIPADGVFLTGHGVKCDESSATGESDQMKKTNGHEVWQQMMSGTATRKLDPFIISGSKVLEGVGTYLVTSVGPNSTYGKIMMSLQTGNDPTPLQVKLGRLANWIGGLGTVAASALFVILFIRFLAQLPGNTGTPAVKGSQFMDIVIVAITMIVVAIPEGLPLAVTLALAFATTRMVKENNLVRVLRACETMGNATVICSDKTGTLTQNKMTVVDGTFGTKNSLDKSTDSEESSSSISEGLSELSDASRDLIVKSIAVNSTAFEGEENGQRTFIGSKTEVAMLQLAQDYMGMNLPEERSNTEVVQLFPFDSARKCMGAVIRLQNGDYRLLVKGAAELMLAKADRSISELENKTLETESLVQDDKDAILDTITAYSKRSLRTIGMVYKDFESWPPKGARTLEEDSSAAEFEDVSRDMTWVGVVGIQDPLRPEVPGAIQRCNNASVGVKMVTGDNMATAVAIASECGIKTGEGIAMEGPKFRQLSDEEMDEVLPKLQVLARSSPEDKRILVARLKHLGETVAVTGDGTNDGPALKTADVGFSMGILGTEVAKEASSIILLDDNFRSIVTAIAWGRAVNDAVAKFLQFQITVNITAVLLTFVSAVSNTNNESVLKAVQLLWVNLIMDTFAALALATDAPTDKILNRKPAPKSASLFTTTMWKMIIGQSIYQLVITFILYFAGAQILNYDVSDPDKKKELETIIFNTFVWMQIFNEFNNRRLDNKLNIFEGMLKNYWFMGINCVMVGGQIMIIFVGGDALHVKPIDGVQWAICIVCAILCMPWAVALRYFPDSYFQVVIDITKTSFKFVWDPLSKGARVVFSPIGRFFKALWAPVSRSSGRVKDKALKKNKATDEEAQPPSDDKVSDNDNDTKNPKCARATAPAIAVTSAN